MMLAVIVRVLIFALATIGPMSVACAHNEFSAKGVAEEFRDITKLAVMKLDKVHFFDGLQSPDFGSTFVDHDVESLIEDIRGIGLTDHANASSDRTSHAYDIILQPGHFLVKADSIADIGGSGKIGGRTIYEQDYSAYITLGIGEILKASGRSVLIIPEEYGNTLPVERVGMFVAIHADSNDNKCSRAGFVRYGGVEDLVAAHAFGLALATALGLDYKQFVDEHLEVEREISIGNNDVARAKHKVVVVLGGLGCPREGYRLLSNSNYIIRNFSIAVGAVLDLSK